MVIDRPIRVPSKTPERWVYLRAWEKGSQGWWRSNGCLLNAALASCDGYRVRVEGLADKLVLRAGTIEENAAALDAYLSDMGAEPVLEGEWPEQCFGPGAHPDRTPWTFEE